MTAEYEFDMDIACPICGCTIVMIETLTRRCCWHCRHRWQCSDKDIQQTIDCDEDDLDIN